MNRGTLLRLAVGVEGGLFLLAVGVGALLDAPPLRLIRWHAGVIAVSVGATVPLLVGLALLLQRRPSWLEGLLRIVQRELQPLFAASTRMDLLLVSLLAGLGEETLFRGLIQPLLEARLPLVPALLVTNLLFGLAHPLSRAYVLSAAGIGLYLSWLQVASGNLLLPILVHALYDFGALLLIRRGAGRGATPAPIQPELDNPG